MEHQTEIILKESFKLFELSSLYSLPTRSRCVGLRSVNTQLSYVSRCEMALKCDIRTHR